MKEDEIQQDETKLEGVKPCPFCGGNNLLVDMDVDGNHVFISCNECYTSGPHAINDRRAKDAWNTRKKSSVRH